MDSCQQGFTKPGDLDIAILEDGIDFDRVNPILLDLSEFGRARQKMMFGAEFFPASLVEGRSELSSWSSSSRRAMAIGLGSSRWT